MELYLNTVVKMLYASTCKATLLKASVKVIDPQISLLEEDVRNNKFLTRRCEAELDIGLLIQKI